jgi:hypothetical protein
MRLFAMSMEGFVIEVGNRSGMGEPKRYSSQAVTLMGALGWSRAPHATFRCKHAGVSAFTSLQLTYLVQAF